MIDTVIQTSPAATERKHRNAVISVVIQLVVCLVGLAVSLRVYLYCDSIKVGAFWSHSVLIVGALLFSLGLYLRHQGRGWMVGGMVLNVMGLIMAFIGVILDAVQAGHIGETEFSRCVYTTSAQTINCHPATYGTSQTCSLSVAKNTCYCCDIYKRHCETHGISLSTQPYSYEGATCTQVQGEFHALLWTSMGFNILGFVVAIVAFALVANYRTLIMTITQAPTVSLMMTQQLNDSFDGRFAHGVGPLIVFSQQQRVGYFPAGIPYPVAPPDYNTAMATAAPPVEPGSCRRQNMPQGMTPVEDPYTAAPYGDLQPPPYAP